MNVEPILHEIKHALDRMIRTGEASAIDLLSMPLAPGEDELIRERLGNGEVVINIDALGPSTLTETAYPGVWWVEHRNSEGIRTSLMIEITDMPVIVLPAKEDLQTGLEALTEHLSEMTNESR